MTVGKAPDMTELLFNAKNQALASDAVQAAVARADAAGLPPAYEPYFSMLKTMPLEEVQQLRRQEAMRLRQEMVEQVNSNQRLEGYEPDEQLMQLQERFIAGELTTSEMIETLTAYARKVQNAPDTPENDRQKLNT